MEKDSSTERRIAEPNESAGEGSDVATFKGGKPVDKRILAVDVGSTTTKACLFQKDSSGWRLLGKTTVPTTVESPHLDVMVGVKSALSKLSERLGIVLMDQGKLISPAKEGEGVDLFVATSSAGGGLLMLVTGLMKEITAESAHRAALGAGAIVSDVISLDDSRMVVERLERIAKLRPDMILVTGGTDGGNISDVAAVSEIVAMAHPRPRFGEDFKIPVVYAGNIDARDYVAGVFRDVMDVTFTENIRPVLEKEVLDPARNAIHDVFLEHVMKRAPGYNTLLTWADGHVKPTPLAVGEMLRYVSQERNQDVLGMDIGGATTDVFSVIRGNFYRTVSANLGMSYSLGNVLTEAKPENILRWLPFEADEGYVRNWHFNKMIRPTTLPETFEELMLEQASAREILRLSLNHHKSLVRGLKGVKQKRDVGDIFNQKGTGSTLINLMEIGCIIGTGGALSYAPRRAQAAMIMIDGIEPEGVTDLFVDSQFLLPHLGVLVDIDMESAREILEREALVPLGTCVAPVGPRMPLGKTIARVNLGDKTYSITWGEIQKVPVPAEGAVEIEIVPEREFDVGGGKGVPLRARAIPGVVGLILDGRGRPVWLPESARERIKLLKQWCTALDAYPAWAMGQDDLVEQVLSESGR